LDAAPQQGHHQVTKSGLFQRGYSKHHNPNLGMIKIMLASIDNEINGFGYPIAHLTVSGEQADDGLYLPIIKECEKVLAATSRIKKKLYVGDTKMGSKGNRYYIWWTKNDYLVPLSKKQLSGNERIKRIEAQDKYHKIYKKDKTGKRQLVAQGFEYTEQMSYEKEDGTLDEWKERRVYVQSSSYAESQQNALDKKIKQTTKELEYLLVRKQGKQTPTSKKALQKAIDEIVNQANLKGLLEVQIKEKRHKKTINAYGNNPERVEKWSTFQLQIIPNEEAIVEKKKLVGWQVYATTVSKNKLSFEKIIWKYRAQNRIESKFNDLRNKVVPLLPIFLKKENRIEALVNVLMICLKVCTVLEFKIAKKLKEEEEELDNIYAGNPKQSTATPTAKKVLEQFKGISVVLIHQSKVSIPIITMTDLNQNVLKIIRLLGFKSDIYTGLPKKI